VPLFKARVYVSLKRGVLDPQGKAIQSVISALGHNEVKDVRQGKFFEMVLDVTGRKEAERLVAKLSDEVLTNPIIESASFDMVEEKG
jgi:phosphoribosylformylglycinamidine synthase PurS subunit